MPEKKTWATGIKFRDMEPSKYGSPLQAIRQECVNCMGGDVRDVRTCVSACCYLWQHKMGCRPSTAAKRGVDIDRAAHPETEGWRDGPREYIDWACQVIRKHCLECVEDLREVENCQMPWCPLFFISVRVSPGDGNQAGQGQAKGLSYFSMRGRIFVRSAPISGSSS